MRYNTISSSNFRYEKSVTSELLSRPDAINILGDKNQMDPKGPKSPSLPKLNISQTYLYK